MSVFYKESNLESTQDLYDKSVIYYSEMVQYASKYSCVVDFAFAEKAMYGKVDRNFISIEPNVITQFKKLPNSEGLASSVEVMSFVADAFVSLSRHFQRSTQIGAIRKGDPYLSNLLAFDGYTEPSKVYNDYLNTLVGAMSSVKDARNIEIKDFYDFIEFYKFFSKEVGRRFPVTKTGFIKSRFNSLMNSGLAIEVTDIVYENDNEKIESFVNSPNFEYYLNACNSYGFMVDLRAPWRIIADLDSVAMQGYASRYGYTSTDSVLLTAYKKTHNSALRELPQQLLEIYNRLITTIIKSEECNGKTKTIVTDPQQYTLQQINNLFNESYFIELYCMLRLTEEEDQHSKAKQDQIITDTINLSSAKDYRFALNLFEKFVSQPFDYRGSLSYIVRSRAKREDG